MIVGVGDEVKQLVKDVFNEMELQSPSVRQVRVRCNVSKRTWAHPSERIRGFTRIGQSNFCKVHSNYRISPE